MVPGTVVVIGCVVVVAGVVVVGDVRGINVVVTRLDDVKTKLTI